MIKIEKPRGGGKTTELIKLAAEHGYVIVEPTALMADYTKHMARDLGHDNVHVISTLQFLGGSLHPGGCALVGKCPALIDNLDTFLSVLNVVGYSNDSKDLQE